jgi:hypothetical protein
MRKPMALPIKSCAMFVIYQSKFLAFEDEKTNGIANKCLV